MKKPKMTSGASEGLNTRHPVSAVEPDHEHCCIRQIMPTRLEVSWSVEVWVRHVAHQSWESCLEPPPSDPPRCQHQAPSPDSRCLLVHPQVLHLQPMAPL